MKFAKGFSQKKGRKKKTLQPKLYSTQVLERSANCFPPSSRLALCSSPHLLLLCRYCLERHTQGVGTHASAAIAERKTDEKRGAKEKDKTRGKRQKKRERRKKTGERPPKGYTIYWFPTRYLTFIVV